MTSAPIFVAIVPFHAATSRATARWLDFAPPFASPRRPIAAAREQKQRGSQDLRKPREVQLFHPIPPPNEASDVLQSLGDLEQRQLIRNREMAAQWPGL
jgi:hypothetical protein